MSVVELEVPEVELSGIVVGGDLEVFTGVEVEEQGYLNEVCGTARFLEPYTETPMLTTIQKWVSFSRLEGGS